MYHYPVHLADYHVYDVFCSDDNKLVIIMPAEPTPPPKIEACSRRSEGVREEFELIVGPHGHVLIYRLDHAPDFEEVVVLYIDGIRVETAVSKYPHYPDEIIMSTIVKNEDAFIRQWIDYHLGLGISRFIIYDNSANQTLGELLSSYISEKIVYLIKWQYPYRLECSGISGQVTQQNHSIYAFQKSKYIGLFDIDEYVNPQLPAIKTIGSMLDHIIRRDEIDVGEISSFRLLNKFFYNPCQIPVRGGQNFLRIVSCGDIVRGGHEKNFVIPGNVKTFSVHMVTSGKEMFTVSEKDMFFNHYYFLNKITRGTDATELEDRSILSRVDFSKQYH